MISHGATKTLKEITTVKSDYHSEKERLIDELVKKGTYSLEGMKERKKEGKTKQVVNTLLQFLKD
jgi:DNA-directed RNA polymerase beta subunit